MGNCCGARRSKAEGPFSYHRNISGTGNVSDENVDYSALSSSKVLNNVDKKIVASPPSPGFEGDILSSPNLKAFKLSDLMIATRNFCRDDLIGEGGFGDVYKGWIDEKILGDVIPRKRMIVAVKKLKPDGLQGHKEWVSEVNYLGQLHHPNLVKLIGYCLDGKHRLLVYEYMPKGSLENHLFERETEPLSWEVRIKLATGAARGLSFLHEQQIIYRDFKASNILLDPEFNVKLSDFGLAKAGPTGNCTHVTTQVLGTHGYVAPEYIATGRLTTRCDVYSFGIVLLELLTGRRALDKTKAGIEQNLLDWVKPYLGDRRKLFRIMDTRLQGQYPQRGAFMVALLAFQCIGEAKLRPPMSEILPILEELPSIKYGASRSPSEQSLNLQRSPTNMSLVGSPPLPLGTNLPINSNPIL